MSKFVRYTFLASLFLIFLLPPTDPDLGWHLRCGQLFWQEHSFCEQNQFSVLLENYSWPNHAWGYQAMIYKIYQFFGIHGLTIFNALLMTAAFGFLYLAVKNCTFEKMLAILATIYFGWGVFSFGIRSQLVGFFFFNLTLWLLTGIRHSDPERSRRGKNPSACLKLILPPLVMLLWANTHGSVILGLLLIFFFTASYLIQHAIACKIKSGKPLIRMAIAREIRQNSTDLINIALLISPLLAAGVTLINPFGFRTYKEMWKHFAGPIDLSKLIAEWVPPQPHIQQLIVISGAAIFVYLLFKYFTTPSFFILHSLFLIPIFTFWALKARRNVPFFFVILSYSFLNTLKPKMSVLRNQLAGLLSVGILLYGLIVQLPRAIEYKPCQRDVPCKAVEFLKAQEDKGNIFNRYEWGGFLICQLPEYKIFVDGRMPAWSSEALAKEDRPISPYTIYLHTLQTRPGWQETLDNYNIDWILISPGTFMDLLLAPDPEKFGWKEVFRDKVSVIYKKI